MTVRKSSAILAVSALVLLSVATGSTAAYAVIPGPPTIDATFLPWITSDTQPSLTGDKELDVTQIDVRISNDVVDNVPYCTVPAIDGATMWFNCTPTTATLALGDNYLMATATNVDGTSVPGPSILITLMNPPTITSPADDIYTNDYMPTFMGAAEGSYFTVLTTDESNEFCTGTVVNLSWNCEVASPGLLDGDYEYIVTTSIGATEIPSASRTIHIDTVLSPLLTDITGPSGTTLPSGTLQSSTTDETPTISGTAEPFATITMWQDYLEVGCAGGAPVADASGDWSCTLAVPLATPGMYVFGSQQTDRAGNTNVGSSPDPQLELTYIDTTPPAPPVVTSPIGTIFSSTNFVITNSTGATVTGTGEPGATLDILGNECMIVPTLVDSEGNWSCELTTPMTPDGTYDVHFGLTDAAGNSSALTSPYLSFFVDTTAPGVPEVWTPTGTLSSEGVIQATTTNVRPVITGMGEGGATVRIYRDGSMPVPCLESPLISGEGGFSCTVSAALSPGVHTFGFAQTDEAGNSSGAPMTLLQLTVLAPPVPPAAPVPPATVPLFSWLLDFQASSSEVLPGQNVTFTASNLPPGATVTADLHSTPVFLGTTTVKSDGTFILNTVIPHNIEPGDHHYVVTVTPDDGTPASTVEQPVTIMTAPVAADPAPAPDEELPTESFGGTVGQSATVTRDEPAAPNTLSQALPTVQQIIGNPVVIGAAAASSLALLFLVAFPAELLNSTIDENYERMFGRIPKLKLPWLKRLRERLKKAPLVGGLALTALAGLIFSFSDPQFGFDVASLRLFLACVIGMFVLGYVANAITGAILRKRWSIGSVIELQPLGLVVAIVGVVLSRVLDFAPGLLIGLVLGLSLSASATLREEARSVLIWAGIVLGLAIACWVAYSLMSGVVAPDTFGGALFDDTLVAIATEGISGLVIGLLPVGYLDGASVFRHSKVQWIATYLVALVAFFVIVVPSGALWGDIRGPFWIWLTVLLVFAAVCVGTFLYFRFRRTEADEESTETHSGDPVLESAGR